MTPLAGATRVRLRSRAPLFTSNLVAWVVRLTRWLLRLLNPHARVWIDRHPLHLGDGFRVEWFFRPGITPLRDIRITFEGAELSLESDGEDFSTDVCVFSTTPIYEGPFDGVVRGSGQAAVPLSTMPSFGSGTDRIEWTIHITGTPRVPWPRTDDHYVVKVLPDAVR